MPASNQNSIPFTKMHGAGNDYIYIDCFRDELTVAPALLATQISDRHKGIGGDGLILICPSEIADAKMRMFNADGSESEMCGNGIRCVAKYLFDHGICNSQTIRIETGAGILALDISHENGKVYEVKVDMGVPILTPPSDIPTRLGQDDAPVVDLPLVVGDTTVPVTCVSMGNPHCIIFVDDTTTAPVRELGPQIENHAAFPSRVNVEFVEVVSPTEVRQRTWERGSGETMACGTGASAVCVAGVLTGRTERTITNHLLGGTLKLEWNEANNRVSMTGPATEVFSGHWPLNNQPSAAAENATTRLESADT